jgi:hypothetical protein
MPPMMIPSAPMAAPAEVLLCPPDASAIEGARPGGFALPSYST